MHTNGERFLSEDKHYISLSLKIERPKFLLYLKDLTIVILLIKGRCVEELRMLFKFTRLISISEKSIMQYLEKILV